MLPPDGWTTLKGELNGLSTAENIKFVFQKALDGWLDIIHTCCDSGIELLWVQHEHLKLGVFQRNRMINAWTKLNLNEINHVCSVLMPADAGTIQTRWLSLHNPLGDHACSYLLIKLSRRKLLGRYKVFLLNTDWEEFKRGVIYDRGFQEIS